MSQRLGKMPNELEIIMEPRRRRSSSTANELNAVKQALMQRNVPCTCGRPQLQMQMEPPMMHIPLTRTSSRPPHMHPFRTAAATTTEERAATQAANLRKLYARRADDIIVDRDMLTKRDHIDFLAKPKTTGAGVGAFGGAGAGTSGVGGSRVGSSSGSGNSGGGSVFADVDGCNMVNLFGTTGIRLKGGSSANTSGKSRGTRPKRSGGQGRSARSPTMAAMRAEVARDLGHEPERVRTPATTSTPRQAKASKQPVSILKRNTMRYEAAPPGYICSGGICTKIGSGSGGPVFAGGRQCVGGNCPLEPFKGGNCPGGTCVGGSCPMPNRAYRGGASNTMPRSDFVDYTMPNYPGTIDNQSVPYTLGRQQRPY